MSGDDLTAPMPAPHEPDARIDIVGDEAGRTTGLVAGLERLTWSAPGRRIVVVGGLAVISHLSHLHRVTMDVDAVVWMDSPEVLDLLVTGGAARLTNGARLPSGHLVDLITVGAYDPADLPTEALDRMFILAHRWAYDTARETHITAYGARTGLPKASATAWLATPGALAAMKLQSIPRRAGPTIHKRASDAYDLFRLIDHCERKGTVSRQLATAPSDLGDFCLRQARAYLVDEPERTVRWFRTEGSPDMGQISVDDLVATGTPFAESLERRLAQ